MKIERQSQAGFTFIEIVIAIAVLSFGILGLITTTHTVSVSQRHADNATEATMVATNELENIKRLATNEPLGGIYGFSYLVDTSAGGYLDPAVFTGPGNNFTRSKTNDNTTDATIPPGFDRTTRIRVHPANDTDVTDVENFTTQDFRDNIHMIEATITVTWTDHAGIQKNVQLNTILQRRRIIQ